MKDVRSTGEVFPAETTYCMYNYDNDISEIKEPFEHMACGWVKHVSEIVDIGSYMKLIYHMLSKENRI